MTDAEFKTELRKRYEAVLREIFDRWLIEGEIVFADGKFIDPSSVKFVWKDGPIDPVAEQCE